MIHVYDDYYVESDGVCNIILYKKKIIEGSAKGGRRTKEENIGKEVFKAVGYYGTINALINGLSRKIGIDVLSDGSCKSLAEAVEKTVDAVEALRFTVLLNGREATISAKSIGGRNEEKEY